MRVKVLKPAFFNNKKTRVGEILFLKSEKEFSSRWMERLDVPVVAPVQLQATEVDVPLIEKKKRSGRIKRDLREPIAYSQIDEKQVLKSEEN